MPRPAVDPSAGDPMLPVRVPVEADLDTAARAMAIQHGLPNRKIGKHHVRLAVIALVQARFAGEPEPTITAQAQAAWRDRLVEMGIFPPPAG